MAGLLLTCSKLAKDTVREPSTPGGTKRLYGGDAGCFKEMEKKAVEWMECKKSARKENKISFEKGDTMGFGGLLAQNLNNTFQVLI